MSSSTSAQKARGRMEGHTEGINNRRISGIRSASLLQDDPIRMIRGWSAPTWVEPRLKQLGLALEGEGGVENNNNPGTQVQNPALTQRGTRVRTQVSPRFEPRLNHGLTRFEPRFQPGSWVPTWVSTLCSALKTFIKQPSLSQPPFSFALRHLIKGA